ncbi:group II intron reverse transcriptase/maturase [Spirochaetia bacterium]|nr:group II intron reverse transcriptase/maturase [Spirochaetia bacterium]
MNRGEVNTARTANLNGVGTNRLGIRWETIDWWEVEQFINKVQTRIAKAEVKGNHKLVRELQRMLTHSYYAKLWAIRKVTSTKGKRTAGIDKEQWDSPAKKEQAAEALQKEGYKAKALKRVYIVKSNGKKRPLGIPTMTDRAIQAVEALALDPIIESRSDKTSFGFRKGRSSHDAMTQLYHSLCTRNSAQWIVEGDIKACFDEIAHEWLLEQTPMDKQILKEFLKAGYVYEKQLFPTERGTPQGGIISPILANHTLNGIDPLLRQTMKRRWTPKGYDNPKVNFVRYADDFVITAATKEQAEQAKELVNQYIQERGLQLSEEKTLITNIAGGFDLLGWNFKKYNGLLLTKPSKKSQQNVLKKLREVIRKQVGTKQDDLIPQLNPIIDGWSNYHKGAVSRQAFERIDHQIYLMLWKWARRRHPNKNRHWIKDRYWHTVGNNHWIFKNTQTLKKMTDKKIVRHIPLKLDKNPYIDTDYFHRRHYILMVNRRLGFNLEESQSPPHRQDTENVCLSEA